MAKHKDEASMVREALPQYLKLSEVGIVVDLGYPAAALLFAVVDALDNYPLRAKQHFRVLRGDYFGMDLTDIQLDNLYELARNPLVHNAILGRPAWLRGEDAERPFEFAADGTIQIYLTPFLRKCKAAVEVFLAQAPEVVLESGEVGNLRKKSDAYSRQVEKAKLDPTGLGKSAHASGISGEPEND